MPVTGAVVTVKIPKEMVVRAMLLTEVEVIALVFAVVAEIVVTAMDVRVYP